MNAMALGIELAKARRRAGLTQAELATRMGTTQSAVSRAEAGRSAPSLELIDRFVAATGRPLTLTFGSPDPSRQELRKRVRRILGRNPFDPWLRNPTPAEARTLEADGLTRERFQGPPAPASRRG